ncbi:precorrin-6y C5,15-methyltransferase (decarboxylating) subunit CbiE [Paracoccus aestuariivivens]|uniref:Precorrin-6y C5,15-methyltransferase (Decarboxylating) subunit CbiE n=1 Tax=Paracoccus aestuariivivens TaxID=1820333 RepID=A0A6L6JIT1_9RHOB|nr:precorrin-6y C5,15-methyltransferase (decarboxylating) subunit CbiE [Paracoccus aestuariivivens]MTH79771.1 precorrin-6y C5,15-methyltransferase (decarboxylating) subunit CbiE [Paracoccus aestuariivivens]
MARTPWLTIIGIGEDGPEGLSPASRAALEQADVMMGSARHLGLLPETTAPKITWPVPFSDGLQVLQDLKPRRVAVLASGDPFWFGAGSVIARALQPDEWRAIPGPSTFALTAARLGWAIEQTTCLGLHAAPLTRLRPHLAAGRQLIVLLRDGPAVTELGHYLDGQGFGDSNLTILEALGGPRERITDACANDIPHRDFSHPVAVAVACAGAGQPLPICSGIEDGFFETDSQITKRPIRALVLSALAPKPSELLWDIGGGSGSIAIEWLLSHGTTRAIAIEPRPDRADRIRRNADRLGVDRLIVHLGSAPEALTGLPPPQAVFIGGGLSQNLLQDLHQTLPVGTRLVAHAVTLESETLLTEWHGRLGGEMLRIALSETVPLGPKRAWKSAYPVVQWRVTL